MFEKEAEERTIKVHCNHCWQRDADGEYQCTGLNYCSCYEDWRNGAEFGYNKANEWHYVKDGKYPTHENKVLCILGDIENENCEVGYYSQVASDKKRWRFNDYDLPDDSEEDWGVSAWKEIVLPELPKESK